MIFRINIINCFFIFLCFLNLMLLTKTFINLFFLSLKADIFFSLYSKDYTLINMFISNLFLILILLNLLHL